MIYTEYNDSSCNSNPILFTSYEVGHCFIDSSSSPTDDAYYSDSYDSTPTSTPTSGMLSTSTAAAAENLASSLLSRAMSKMTSSIKAEDATATAPPSYQFECYNPNSNGNSYYYYYDDYASSSSLPSSRKLNAGTRANLPSAPTIAPTVAVSSYVFYCDQQEPQIIPTEDETCSSYTYAVLLEATCLAPTASPTIPPTSNDAAQLGVSQTINGCSYTDDYLLAPGLYDKTFRQAIIVSLLPSIPSIDTSSIVDFLVSPSPTAATSIRSRQLQTPSVVISYTLQSASVSYLT